MSESGSESRSRIVGLLLVLTLCLSAFVQFTVASRSVSSNPLTADAGRYFSYAYNLQHSGVYSGQVTWDPAHAEGPLAPDKVRAPGYPIALTAVGDVEPTQDWIRRIYLWQALLGVVTVWLTYLVARELLAPGWALGASALTALSPHLAAATAEILSETLFTTLIMGATLALARALNFSRIRWALLAGGLWGLASIVRPTALLIPPAMAAVFWIMPKLRIHARLVSIVLLVALAVQAPWWIRNQVTPLRQDPTDLSVNFIHHGTYPDFMFEDRTETLGLPYRFDPSAHRDGSSMNHALAAIARHFREEPGRYGHWYLIGKPTAFLSWNIVGGWGDIFTVRPARSPFLESRLFSSIHQVMRILHVPLMLLGITGIALAWLSARTKSTPPNSMVAGHIAALVVAYAIAFHIVGAPFPRYSIPFRPLMYILAMLSLAAIARVGANLFSGRGRRR